MGFELVNVTWSGPKANDAPLLDDLPDKLRWLLDQQFSGFIQFHGGIHFRGACKKPDWHSLRAAWKGKSALRQVYSVMKPDDIPFAQDYLGNQFFWRGGNVMKINGETGCLEAPLRGLTIIGSDVITDPVELLLEAFLAAPQQHPESLGLQLLETFHEIGQSLAPGQLLHVYPPLCSKEARSGVALALKAMDVAKRLSFLAKAVKRVSARGEGEDISFPLLK